MLVYTVRKKINFSEPLATVNTYINEQEGKCRSLWPVSEAVRYSLQCRHIKQGSAGKPDALTNYGNSEIVRFPYRTPVFKALPFESCSYALFHFHFFFI
jgi:hypothetical protein